MPFIDKLVIVFTVLILLAGPYLVFQMIETGRSKDIELTRTMSDGSAAPIDRKVAEIKRQSLPPTVIGQIALLIVTQIGAVVLSALLIRNHKRRLRLRRRG
jgi:hypothetical protein